MASAVRRGEMAYLLDSNVLIPSLADDPATVPLVERLAPRGVAISVVTYPETRQGTLRHPAPAPAQAALDGFLGEGPVLPPSLAVARRCAALREEPTRQGKRVRARAFDPVLAATALEHRLRLVTRNLADFADIPGLSLYQPS